MKPFEIYTEERLVGAGLDEDSAWELSRTFKNEPDLVIPDEFMFDIGSLVNIFELVNRDPKPVVEFFHFLGKNSIIGNTENNNDHDPLEKRSILTAHYFDSEMEELARKDSLERGMGIDTAKYARYEEFGIAEYHVPFDMIPSTRARMIRYLTTTAYVDGFAHDFDLSATMKLINTDPLRIFTLCKDHKLFGESFRIFCELINRCNLFLEELQSHVPGCSKEVLERAISDTEVFMILVIAILTETGISREAEIIAKCIPIIEDFIRDYEYADREKRYYLTSNVLAKHIKPKDLVDFFKRKNDLGNPFKYLEESYGLTLPIIFDDGSTVVDKYWIINHLHEQTV